MDQDLFTTAVGPGPIEQLGAGTWLFRQHALPAMAALKAGLRQILQASPWRRLQTPGGRAISVAITNAGALGWHSDLAGYRYQQLDPLKQQAWPPIPLELLDLARRTAALAGYPDFAADACLINRYGLGDRLSLHQDRNERDLQQPVVSISLGMRAQFLWGGLQRQQPSRTLPLYHGDMLVWGGPDRLRFHGIAPLQGPPHPEWGARRISLTFRHAG